MKDSYANYFCKKFYCILLKPERLKFLNYIRPFGLFIANNQVGTYPLQAVIENLKSVEENNIIIETFKADVISLCLVSLK